MDANKITGVGVTIKEKEETFVIKLYNTPPPNDVDPEPDPFETIKIDFSSYFTLIQFLINIGNNIETELGIKLNLSNLRTENEEDDIDDLESSED